MKKSFFAVSCLIVFVYNACSQVSVPYLMDFETSDGFIAGQEIPIRQEWSLLSGDVEVIASPDAPVGSQYIKLEVDSEYRVSLNRTISNNVDYIDFWLKGQSANFPEVEMFLSSEGLFLGASNFITDVADLTIWDDFNNPGEWLRTGYTIPINTQSFSDWIRVTLRTSYLDNERDLYVDGKLVALSVGQYSEASPFDFSFLTSSSVELQVDAFEYSATNPIFVDADQDGMPDSWEQQFGLNPLINDRSLDPDSDSLTNVEEHLYGTHPNNADTDSDGFSDYDEIVHTTDPNQSSARAAYEQIEVESYDQINEASDQGSYVSVLQANSWIYLQDVDFGEGFDLVELSYRSWSDTNIVEIRLDDPSGDVVGSFQTSVHSASFQSGFIPISEVTGIHDVYLKIPVFAGGLHLDWLKFEVTGADNDGDQLIDSWEYQYFGDLTQSGSNDADGDGVNNLDEQTAGSHPNAQAAHQQIEAESYSEISGASDQGTYIGVSNSGDWIRFGNIDFGAGCDLATISYKSWNWAGVSTIELRIDDIDGEMIGSGQTINRTGNFESLQFMITEQIGVHDVYVKIPVYGGGLHLDWISFELTGADNDADQLIDFWEYQYFGDLTQSGSDDSDGDGVNNLDEQTTGSHPNAQVAHQQIEAESYSEISGASDQGTYIGISNSGDWLCFEDIDFGAGCDLVSVTFRTWSWSGSNMIEIRVDDLEGEIVGSFIAPKGNGEYQTYVLPVIEQSGVHNLYLKFPNYGGGLHLDCFRFDLTGTDSDADDLADAWEYEHFGDLSQSGSDDSDGDGISNLDEQTAGSNPNAQVAYQQIEVETYSEISGASDQGTYIGISNSGDWFCFKDIDFGIGCDIATITYRSWNWAGVSTIEIRIDDIDGEIIGSGQTIIRTGSFESLQFTITEQIGIHDVYVKIPDFGGALHLDWISFEQSGSDSDLDGLSDSWELQYFGDLNQTGSDDTDGDGISNLDEQSAGSHPNATIAYQKIQGNTFDSAQGVSVSGEEITGVDTGDWFAFENLDFGSGVSMVRLQVRNDSIGPTTIEVRTDNIAGPLLGNLEVGDTGSSWSELSLSFSEIQGVHNVYFVFSDVNSDVRLGWIEFLLSDGDSDENGLADVWEYHYFNTLGQNPQDDPDNDGFSNLEEYQNESDPTILSGFRKIQVEDTTNFSGVSVNSNDVQSSSDGDWMNFESLDFGNATVGTAFIHYHAESAGKSVELRYGSVTGTLIGSIDLLEGNDPLLHTISFPITLDPASEDVFLVFKGSGADIVTVDWIGFAPQDIAADSDSNELWDAWEWIHFTSLGTSKDQDSDSDGLTHFQEQNLGFDPFVAQNVNEVLSVSGTRLWLDASHIDAANGAIVSVWEDLSGNLNDAIVPYSGAEPTYWDSVLNNAPIMRFTSGKYLQIDDPMSGANTGEIYIVVKAAGESGALTQFGTYTYGGGGRYGVTSVSDTFGADDLKNVDLSNLATSQYHLYNASSATDDWRARINGVLLEQDTSNNVAFIENAKLGGGFSGDVAEVIVFDRVLSKDERRQISSYLSQKYDLFPIPPAVENLKIVSVSDSQAYLSWNAIERQDNISYVIERRLMGGEYIEVASVAGNGYMDTSLVAGNDYQYRVKVSSLSGDGNYSIELDYSSPSLNTDEIPIESLRLWLDGSRFSAVSGVSVDTWYDQSLYGNHASGEHGGAAPSLLRNALNGHSVIDFDSTIRQSVYLPDLMNQPSVVTAAEVFVVVKSTSHAEKLNPLWSFQRWVSTPLAVWYSTMYPNLDGMIEDRFGAYHDPVSVTTDWDKFNVYSVSLSDIEWRSTF
ncbi:MAG: carbohydrate-binding protein, partial [Opitutales bacterium]|nr:carbohydrate-binding protein [Opitutales bacterium]